MWKREEIAPKEKFLLFSTIFSVYLYFQESNYIFLCETWLFDLSFLLNSANLICRETDIAKYFSESLGPRDNESRLYIGLIPPSFDAFGKLYFVFVEFLLYFRIQELQILAFYMHIENVMTQSRTTKAGMRYPYSGLSLSRSPRDCLKYFEISVSRHIRFAELR